MGLRSLLANISADRTATTIRLHGTFGFQPVAHLRQVGTKFNQWLDGVYMQLLSATNSPSLDRTPPPLPVTAKDLFLAYLAAYNARDVDAMLAGFDDACVFEHVAGGKVAVRTEGKAALAALARQSAAAFASREQRVLSITEQPGRLTAEIDYHAVLQADLSPELKSGTELKLRGVSVVEFAGGKIVRLTDYA